MKITISIPDDIFEAAEKLARGTGITRDELYERAIIRLVERYEDIDREALDNVYSKPVNCRVDPFIRAAAAHTLADENW